MDEDMLFLLLPVGFFILSLGIALTVANYSRRRTREKAEALARYLGIQMRVMEPSGIPGIPGISIPAWASFLLPDRWSIHGTYSGVSVEIHMESRGSGKSQTVYTCIGASFAVQLGAGLKITREGFWSKVGKALLSSQDITLGDGEFDPKVMVKAQNEGVARQWLSDPFLRSRILAFLEKYPQGWLDDAGAHLDVAGTWLDPEKVRDLLQTMTPLVIR